MPGGRPSKIDMEEIKDFQRFPGKEKDLGDMLEKIISRYCEECLGEEYIKHTREWYFRKIKKFGSKDNSSIDFMIETRNGLILLEIKNPSNNVLSEMMSGIGQMLVYKTKVEMCGYNVYRTILLSTRTTREITGTIKHLKLPIEIHIIYGPICGLNQKYIQRNS